MACGGWACIGDQKVYFYFFKRPNDTTRISWKLKSLRHVNSSKFLAEPLFQEFAPTHKD